MRKLAIALAALAAIGIAAPATSGAAQAQDKVVIKKDRPAHKKVVIKKEHRGTRVVIKHRHHHPMHKKVVIKERS